MRLRGEIVGDVLTDFPERFDDLKRVSIVYPNGEIKVGEIEKFWFQKGRIVLKFVGFDSIEAAETLRECEVCIPETEAVELETDEYFDWELENCTVETIEGEANRHGQRNNANRRHGSFGRHGRSERISDSVCRNNLHGR